MALIDDTRMQQALTRIKGELDDRDSAIEEIQGTVTEMEGDVSDLKSAIDSAPSEESGAELIAELSASAGLDEIFLESLGWYIDNLPQDESGQDIVDALTLEADRLAALYEIWEAERSA